MNIHWLNQLCIGNATPVYSSTLSKTLLNLHQNLCTANVLHIYPTLQEVREFNNDIQKKVSTHFYNHAAHIFSPFKVNSPGQIVPHDLIPPDDGQWGGLPRRLSISLKTRVMLLRDVCTKEWLINGVMDFVTNFKFIDCSLSFDYYNAMIELC